MEKNMADTYTAGQELQGQILDAVRKSQEMAIEAIKTWADALQPVLSAMPPVTLPLAGKLPKPEEFVGSTYNFAGQLLASQQKFAEDVFHVTAPLTAVPAKNASSPQK
jgi:hypothetical protein